MYSDILVTALQRVQPHRPCPGISGGASTFQAASTAAANKDAIAAVSDAAKRLQEIMEKAARLRASSQLSRDTRQGKSIIKQERSALGVQ
jgi:hypothetical protein